MHARAPGMAVPSAPLIAPSEGRSGTLSPADSVESPGAFAGCGIPFVDGAPTASCIIASRLFCPPMVPRTRGAVPDPALAPLPVPAAGAVSLSVPCDEFAAAAELLRLPFACALSLRAQPGEPPGRRRADRSMQVRPPRGLALEKHPLIPPAPEEVPVPPALLHHNDLRSEPLRSWETTPLQ